jgi:hypothetical protein
MPSPNDKFDVYRQILERAWSDPDFKARLLANPEQVLAKEFNIKLAAGQSITVLVQTEPQNLLHLPPGPEEFIC